MFTAIKRVWLLLLFLLTVVIIGTIVFMFLEKLSLVDAFYFTIVTISTVGYGDIYPTSVASKLFSIILIVTGIGSFLTIITHITQSLVARAQDQLRNQRHNMLIGIFFTEVGDRLLKIFSGYDPDLSSRRKDLLIGDNWSSADFNLLKRKVQLQEFTIDTKLIELDILNNFLKERGDFFVRQMENSDLMENELFTDLLWAVIHLRDELLARDSLLILPETDLNHLANDAKRAYNLLVRQWMDYLPHLKRRYPYLFSLALRTNPFIENASAIIN